MKRRPCLMAAVMALCACAVSAYFAAACALSAAAAAIILILIITGRVRKNVLIPVIIFTIFLIFYKNLQNLRCTDEELCSVAEECADGGVRAVVLKTEEKNGSVYVYTRGVRYKNKETGILLIQSEVSADLIPGCTVLIQGSVRAMSDSANPGQFDAMDYYGSQGYFLRGSDASVTVVKKANIVFCALFSFKNALTGVISEISCDDDREIYLAMLLGDKSELSDDTRDLFSEGGISHILAISGLHISFIGYAIYRSLRKCTGSYAASSLITSVCLMLYTFMTGASISSLRACAMMLITLAADCLGRSSDMLSNMSAAWILISFLYPLQYTQAQTLLSFGAIFGLGLMFPVMDMCVKEKKDRSKEKKTLWIRKFLVNLRSSVVSSAAVSLVTWPVLAWFFYEISVYSLFVNLMVLPLTPALFGFMIAAALTGLVTGSLTAAGILILPSHAILWFYRKICLLTEEIPGHMLVTGRPLWWQILAYAALVTIFLTILYLYGRKRELRLENPDFGIIKTGEIVAGAAQNAFLCLLLLVLICGLRLLVRYREEGLLVCYMDVGQGDGIYVQTEDAVLFIDGGSTSVDQVGTYRIKPLLQYYGVVSVDAWILTHPDKDHISGLMQLLEDYEASDTPRIDSVMIPLAGSTDSGWDELNTLLDECGVQKLTVAAGDCLSAKNLSCTWLYPNADDVADDTNNYSAVFRVDYKQASFMFTGDIGTETETLICERYASDLHALQADVLKVAHHGSKYSSCEDFLAAVGADIAVISCGVNNYGHPAAETLERLEDAGMSVHVTLDEGAFIVRVGKEN